MASAVRNALNSLYFACAVLAAVFLAATAALMLIQVAGREVGIQVRGADDLTGWFCAASAFLPMAHTFKQGELIRVGLFLGALKPQARWWAEIFALGVSMLLVGYMTYAVVKFVYESWEFNEIAQGLILIPIWIPQLSFLIGAVVLAIAIVDELILVLQRQKPTYQVAEEDRIARQDFTESV